MSHPLLKRYSSVALTKADGSRTCGYVTFSGYIITVRNLGSPITVPVQVVGEKLAEVMKMKQDHEIAKRNATTYREIEEIKDSIKPEHFAWSYKLNLGKSISLVVDRLPKEGAKIRILDNGKDDTGRIFYRYGSEDTFLSNYEILSAQPYYELDRCCHGKTEERLRELASNSGYTPIQAYTVVQNPTPESLRRLDSDVSKTCLLL